MVMASSRLLIRSGTVLTLDPQLGDLSPGEVLVEDGEIVAVGADLGVTDAEVIDARGLDRDAGLRRHPPAHVAGGDPQHRRRLDPRPLHDRDPQRAEPALPSRRTPTPATCSARSKRSTPASPRCSTGRTTWRPPSTPTRRCRRSSTPARGACSPTAAARRSGAIRRATCPTPTTPSASRRSTSPPTISW